MHSVTVTIGRNFTSRLHPERTQELSAEAWKEFIEDVKDALSYHMIEDEDTLEVHLGSGSWQGIEEESAKVTLLSSDPIFPAKLIKRLKTLAAIYAQDAIALTIGESELIEP